MENEKSFGSYHLFAGKLAEDTVKINRSQAENSAEGLSYRIPTLLNTSGGAIIAMADMSESGGDFGRIQVMMRRSEDGGKSFGKMKTVLSLPVQKAPQKRNDFLSAFAIDPILTECANGEIIMIVDMYPECCGIMKKDKVEKSTGYTEIGGKRYFALHPEKTKIDGGKSDYRDVYTVRENGFVYTPDGRKTNYYLPKNHSFDCAFETAGDLYFAVGEPDYIEACPPLMPDESEGRDIYCGNVFISCGKGVFDENTPKRVRKRTVSRNTRGERYSKYFCTETDAAPLTAAVTSYLWVLRSRDGGRTWQTPQDISSFVKHGDEIFLGTGPGAALTLKNQADESKNGRILAPVYNLKKTAVIFSDDGGETWKRSEDSMNIDESQLAELSDGTLLCFGRQRRLSKTPFSVSLDGGETWEKRPETGLSAVRCQKSFITVSKSAYTAEMDAQKDYIIACCPSGHGQRNSARFCGVLTLGEVQPDKSIDWRVQRRITLDCVSGKDKDFFAYSCMTYLRDGRFGLMFEAIPCGFIVYDEFSLEWLLGGEKAFSFPLPLKTRIKVWFGK